MKIFATSTVGRIVWIWVIANITFLWLTSVTGLWYEKAPDVMGIDLIGKIAGQGAKNAVNWLADYLLRLLA